MSGKQAHRRPLADCAMRSHFVVVLAPRFDLPAGVVKIEEPVLVQAIKPDTGIEALDERIVCGLARPAEVEDDTVCIRPEIELPRGELAAIVDPDAARFAKDSNGVVEHRDDVGRSRLVSDPERRTDPGEVVDQGQNPKPRTIEQLIIHPVHGPTVIGCNGGYPIIPQFRHDPSPRRLVSHL